MSATVLYYSDNVIPETLQRLCLSWLRIAVGNLPIVSVTFEPLDLGTNIVVGKQRRSEKQLYRQMEVGVQAIKTTHVYCAEHDVVYPQSHFQLPEPERVMYDQNRVFLTSRGWLPSTKTYPMSGVVANRDELLRCVQERLKDRAWRPNPAYPVCWGKDSFIDIRWGGNYTGNRGGPNSKYVGTVPYWGHYKPWLVYLELDKI